MAGEVVERQQKGGKKGLRRQKRRISIRIDMTPMVDIAFLLLIFYMVSTVFAMPQAMEINLPPPDQDEPVEVGESHLLSIRVDQYGRYWWNMGVPKGGNIPVLLPSVKDLPDSVFYRADSDSLRGLLVAKNRADDKLSTLILIHRDASYADMVDILDEIDLIERSWNAAIAEQLRKPVKDLTKEDGRFSYRYAMDKWRGTDDKIIETSAQAAGVPYLIEEGGA